jgi:hypothetical protein
MLACHRKARHSSARFRMPQSCTDRIKANRAEIGFPACGWTPRSPMWCCANGNNGALLKCACVCVRACACACEVFVCACAFVCSNGWLLDSFGFYGWQFLFVCLCVCFLSNRKGRTLRRSTWFHLVQPSPHIGCSAGIGTPDEVILPTTNTPRYSRFDPNRPDPNPIEDKVKEHIMAVSQQALASVPSRHHHVADCDVFKHLPRQKMAPGIEPGTNCKCLQADARPSEL